MPPATSSLSCNVKRILTRACVTVAATFVAHAAAAATAITLPAAPQTFDTTYAAPTGATIKVAAGGDLQAALNDAQLGDTIVLEAGATFTGPFHLPNKTTGSGWIYVVSSNLASLPAPGQRVAPKDAANMPKLVSLAYNNAITTIADSHHFRFVGIEFLPVAGAAEVYQLISIGNADASTATLPHHIVFDRCYVHGTPGANDRRGIEMDGAYVAVVDSYISDFQESNTDAQGLWAYNTSGPLQIRDNYIEAATENVMFGGADSRAASLVPSDIEISNNYFFKPLTLIGTAYPMKNLLEFKSAQRVLVTGNTFQNNPAGAQNGFTILLTPRNQTGGAPWSITADIAITNNTIINAGSGFNLAGHDSPNKSGLTARVLIRNNLVGITGLNGADGRAFEVTLGGSDYTIDHNTIVNTSPASKASDIMFAESPNPKVSNFAFTNNLATPSKYGFYGNSDGAGTPALTANFSNWVFAKNVIVGAPAGSYPAGNFFPTSVAAVDFVSYSGANYALASSSPYRSAGTDGTDIGADLSSAAMLTAVSPNPPGNVAVK
jgi:hypothetical protein